MDCNTKKFEFNAPQFLDFTSSVINDDGADSFFDTDHEQDRRLTQVYQPVSSSSNSTGILPIPNSPTNSDGVSSSNNSAEPFQNISDIANIDKLESALHVNLPHPPPSSARKIRTSYAPQLQTTKVNGEFAEGIVMAEVVHQGMPTNCRKSTTTPKPFSFEERDRRLKEMKERKIKKMLEEEKKMREFHANPLPNFSRPFTLNTNITVTNPVDIELQTAKRIEERHKRAKPGDEKEEKFEFKARPAVVLQKPPFEPLREHAPLTEFNAFELNTERRAQKREEFDSKVKEREMWRDEMLRERQASEKRKMLEEIRQLRKSAVHKAKPVPRKIIEQAFQVAPSSAPLTEPNTPTVLKRKRRHE